MRTRRFLLKLLASVLLTGASVGLAWYPGEHNAIAALARPGHSNPAVVSHDPTSHTVGPDDIGRLFASAASFCDAATADALSVIKLLAVGVSLAAMVWLLLVLLRRPRQLVIQDIVNASGNPALDPMLPGLSTLMRQCIAKQTRQVRQLSRPDHRLVTLPKPQEALDSTLSDLTTSLIAAVPTEIKPLVQVFATFFPPRGTLVTATLQQCGDTPGRLGITYSVVALSRQRRHAPYTIWEPARQPPTNLAAAADGAPAGTDGETAPDKSPGPGRYSLGCLYEQLGALDKAQAQYETILQQAADRRAQESLAALLQRKDRTLSERSLALLEGATHWPVVQLYKDVHRAHVQRTTARRRARDKRRAAQWARFSHDSGVWYLAGAGPGRPWFYDLARNEFNIAIAALRPFALWWEACASMGDTYLLQATDKPDTGGQAQDAEERRSYLAEAQSWYGCALEHLGTDWRQVGLADGKIPLEDSRWKAERRLKMGQARARLHLGDAEAATIMKEVIATWDLARETNGTQLYNAATFYGCMAAMEEDPVAKAAAIQRARALLAYSLLRNPNHPDLLPVAEKDPDLEAVRTAQDDGEPVGCSAGAAWRRFKFAVLKHSCAGRTNGTAQVCYQDAAREVLRAAGWTGAMGYLRTGYMRD